MISIHDNNVYGCSLDFEHQRLTLHTCFLERSPQECTDVVFHGVVAHHFEHMLRGNILFDIVEVSPETIVDSNVDLFGDSWRYGWPAIEYHGDLDMLKSHLTMLKGFDVQSSYGLSGWVLCEKCERVCRERIAILS